jgi:hypothetical protein
MSIDLQIILARTRVFIPMLALLLTKTSVVGTPYAVPSTATDKGEFGGELTALTRYHTPPAGPSESNHFIDMWSGGKMRDFARGHGLTNNRALFVISHARALRVKGKQRYALYPGESRITRGAKTAYYSPQDIARVLGGEKIKQIDNLVVSGCNSENVFSREEWRACFPNATNIIHAAPGKDGYDILLRHALIYRSSEIKWLYEMPDSFTIGRFDEEWSRSKRRPRLNLYLASLYEPNGAVPFAVQIAGRELLERPARVEQAKASATPVRTERPKVIAPPAPAAVRTEPRPPAMQVAQLTIPAPKPANAVAQPKVASRREPIIMRGSTARTERDRRSKPSSFKPVQTEAAMGILGVVFGGCCIAWSFGLGSRTSDFREENNRPIQAEEESRTSFRVFVFERLRKLRQRLKKERQPAPAEETSAETSDVESSDPADRSS